MSKQEASVVVSPTATKNEDTPTKRTPSKRKSHIERIQEESKELLKNMGVEDFSDERQTRRSTRSSTKSQPPAPVTPPTPLTPNSSRRGRKKKIDEDVEESPASNDNDNVVDSTVVVKEPPKKRAKLIEVINEEEEKQQSEEIDGPTNPVEETPSSSTNGRETGKKMEVDEQQPTQMKAIDAKNLKETPPAVVEKSESNNSGVSQEMIHEPQQIENVTHSSTAEHKATTPESAVDEPKTTEEEDSTSEAAFSDELTKTGPLQEEVVSKKTTEEKIRTLEPVEAMEVDSSSVHVEIADESSNDVVEINLAPQLNDCENQVNEVESTTEVPPSSEQQTPETNEVQSNETPVAEVSEVKSAADQNIQEPEITPNEPPLENSSEVEVPIEFEESTAVVDNEAVDGEKVISSTEKTTEVETSQDEPKIATETSAD